ncbi:MAG: hypothetical protein ABI772_05635, partial [Bacteroidota bacterium]
MKYLLPIILFFFCTNSTAQKRDYNWVFGDSVGINFNTVPPSVDTTRIIMTIEPAASISDENGNLLFYVGSPEVDILTNYKKCVVRSSDNSIMVGGDSIAGYTSVTQGLIIIPDSYDTAKYYIFHIGYFLGLYYSIVDISLNNGLGEIISANNILKSYVTEKMHAVKAANGKDWWIIGMVRQGNSDYFYKFKLDSAGIANKGQQLISSQQVPSWAGQIIFSPNGDKLIYTGGMTENSVFDFDRCTGEFMNRQLLNQGGHPRYGASFSPS